ncbi:MAG: hypothetical protein JW718_00195 [Desulfovibrionaceae bacterium]|nr:hypothetical protein [Desulfovibrionaceae bacterium]
MRTKTIILALAALAVLAAGGCSWTKTKRGIKNTYNEMFDNKPTASPLYIEDDTPIIELNYEAADELVSDLKSDIPKTSRIYRRPFLNADDPGDKAPLGRVVADQVAAYLAQKDFPVVNGPPPAPAPAPEAKSAEEQAQAQAETQAGGQGEGKEDQGLFRPKDTALKKPMDAVLEGSYTVGENVIYVSATVTLIEDGTVVSGYQWTLPINRNTRELLPRLKDPGGLSPSVSTRLGD